MSPCAAAAKGRTSAQRSRRKRSGRLRHRSSLVSPSVHFSECHVLKVVRIRRRRGWTRSLRNAAIDVYTVVVRGSRSCWFAGVVRTLTIARLGVRKRIGRSISQRVRSSNFSSFLTYRRHRKGKIYGVTLSHAQDHPQMVRTF